MKRKKRVERQHAVPRGGASVSCQVLLPAAPHSSLSKEPEGDFGAKN